MIKAFALIAVVIVLIIVVMAIYTRITNRKSD